MTDYSRSKSYSYSDDRMQVDIYRGGPPPYYGQGGRPDDINNNRMGMQLESYNPYGPYGGGGGARSSQQVQPSGNDYFRSYSVSHAEVGPPGGAGQWQVQKAGKSTSGGGSSSSGTGTWSMNDPEFQRRKRVASYKVYSVEGKVKGGFRRSFRWIKNKYTQVVYGWW